MLKPNDDGYIHRKKEIFSCSFALALVSLGNDITTKTDVSSGDGSCTLSLSYSHFTHFPVAEAAAAAVASTGTRSQCMIRGVYGKCSFSLFCSKVSEFDVKPVDPSDVLAYLSHTVRSFTSLSTQTRFHRAG